MPLIVNHDVRRDELAAVVAKLIATSGLEAVTVRTTAKASNFSTRVVSHYFSGKRELLLHCFRFTARRGESRIRAAIKKDPADLTLAVSSLLPYNAEAHEDWLVWVAFWGVAIADSEFSNIQRLQFIRSTAMIQSYLPPFVKSKQKRKQLAQEILSALIGMAVQASYAPKEWPRARQEGFMKGIIDRCLTPQSPDSEELSSLGSTV